jgi:hypothetical protein
MKSFKNLTLAAALAASFVSLSQAHAGRRLIEVGVDVGGGAVATPWDAQDAAEAFSTNGSVDFNFLFLSASADASYTRVGGSDVVEIQADGAVAFAKLHEYYYRSGGPNGEMSRVFAGLGGKLGFGSLGDLTLSVGAVAMDWTRPGSAEQSLLGAYAGGKLYLHIWKFENELRVAYFAAPQINGDAASVAAGEPFIQGWTQGMVGSNNLRFEAFKVSMFSFGPELRANVAELPDGFEWKATLGFGGKIGAL